MLKTILLPLDGSSLAERALRYAAVLARRCEARVVLVQAVQAHTLPGTDPSEAQVDVTTGAEQYLRTAVGRLGADGIVSETHVYYDDPVHAILDLAVRQQADLIVMATHGRGGLGRMLYGSVADQILRRATIPVLLVPSIVEHAWPADGPLSLLIPLDGSELATQALQAAELLTESFGSRVTLLRVVQPVPYPLYGEGYAYVPYDEDAEVADARRYLDEQATWLGERGVHVTTDVVVGDPARAIGEIARAKDVDVVVMATHGHVGLSRLILGSVATATLRHTTAPLLLVRPSAAQVVGTECSVRDEAGSSTDSASSRPVIAGEDVARTITVQVSEAELELVDHGLRALGHAPGYDYGHVLAARALADRLKCSAHTDAVEPVSTR
jgi:nucleotide-binding universal stress UspA family protein